MQSVTQHNPGTGFAILPGALLALCWLLLLKFLGGAFLGGAPWQALVALHLAAAPLVLAFLYKFVVDRTLKLQRFEHGGWLFRLLSSRVLGIVLALAGGGGGAVFLLLWLHVLEEKFWHGLFAALPLLLLVQWGAARWLRREFKAFLVWSRSLSLARLLTPTLLTALLLFLGYFQAEQDSAAASLSSSVAQASQALADLEGSKALRLMADYLVLKQGGQGYLVALLREPGLQVVLAAAEYWLLLYFLCVGLGFFLLPLREWRRLIVPFTELAEAPQPYQAQWLRSIGLGAAILCFLVEPLLFRAELWVRAQQELVALPERVVLRLERIEQEWYLPGTAARLLSARQEALALGEPVLRELDRQVDLAFGAMEQKVDDYLDWHYSLGGEYARMAMLLTGNLEQGTRERLLRTLQEGDDFARVQALYEAALAAQARASRRFEAEKAQILASNHIDPGEYRVESVPVRELDAVLDPVAFQGLEDFGTRLNISGAGGFVGAVVGGRVAARVAGKAGFRAAARFFGTRMMGGMLGGAGAGTVVLPGIGTAVGAVVGGVATALVIDKALVEVDEMRNRERVRGELVEELGRVREEFRLSVAGLPE